MKTVVWTDFGGVLTPPLDDALARVATAAEIPPDVLLAAIHRMAARDATGPLEPLELGRISQRDWGDRLTAELAPGWVPRISLRDFGDYWYADRPLNTVLYERLAEVRDPGHRLGMLTNSVREWEVHRARMLPAPSVFDAVIRSHEVGLRKPDAGIYRLAERTFDVTGKRCLLIDDVAANCDAAQARGWQAIHHVTNETTLAALETLLR